jgi:hypothetical protein
MESKETETILAFDWRLGLGKLYDRAIFSTTAWGKRDPVRYRQGSTAQHASNCPAYPYCTLYFVSHIMHLQVEKKRFTAGIHPG